MDGLAGEYEDKKSLPAKGVWIEIAGRYRNTAGRPVTPRKGSVD